jgi:glycerophosphoryl diester phosphodiesterase
LRPLVLAHRGAPREDPENSLAAFRRLSTLGVDGVELDVQVTSDGVPVVAHDVSLGGHRIEALTYEALREMQGAALQDDMRIPTLDAVLAVIPDHFLVNLEIKSEHSGPNIAAAINGAHSCYRIVVTSFDATPLIRVRQAAPEIRTGLVVGMQVADLLGPVRDALGDVVSVYWKLVTPELVRTMRENGGGADGGAGRRCDDHRRARRDRSRPRPGEAETGRRGPGMRRLRGAVG